MTSEPVEEPGASAVTLSSEEKDAAKALGFSFDEYAAAKAEQESK